MNRMMPLAAAVACTSAALLPEIAVADPVAISATRPDAWEFGALIYGYYPSIGGTATFPNGQSADISVDASKLIDHLKFAVLGSFEARKGSWGIFSDVMYLNVGEFKSQTRNFSIGHVGLPADVSASANFDLKTVVWTVAGTYRVMSSQDAVVDLFAGARLLDIKQTLDWTLNGNVGQFPAPGRAGNLENKENFTDGIAGLKGRQGLGKDLKWFIPYYGDIGTGNSELTWQLMGGLGYAFQWGDVIGGYRYLDYKFKSDSKIDSMNLSGPVLGAAFHW